MCKSSIGPNPSPKCLYRQFCYSRYKGSSAAFVSSLRVHRDVIVNDTSPHHTQGLATGVPCIGAEYQAYQKTRGKYVISFMKEISNTAGIPSRYGNKQRRATQYVEVPTKRQRTIDLPSVDPMAIPCTQQLPDESYFSPVDLTTNTMKTKSATVKVTLTPNTPRSSRIPIRQVKFKTPSRVSSSSSSSSSEAEVTTRVKAVATRKATSIPDDGGSAMGDDALLTETAVPATNAVMDVDQQDLEDDMAVSLTTDSNLEETKSSDGPQEYIPTPLEGLEVTPATYTSALLVRLRGMDLVQKQRLILNVGGRIFETSAPTLNNDPSSLLSHMVSPSSPMKPYKVDHVYTYFLDRSPKMFDYILCYLRNGMDVLKRNLPNNVLQLRELLTEIDFYGLKEMKTVVEEKCREIMLGFSEI